MNMSMIVLVLQIGVAVVFFYFGMLKIILPLEKIEKKVSWANDYPISRLRLFGLCEVLGALGLVLPYQLDIFPILTPVAATALAMVMSGAAMVHLKRDEIGMIFVNIFIVFLLAGIGYNSLIDILNVDVV